LSTLCIQLRQPISGTIGTSSVRAQARASSQVSGRSGRGRSASTVVSKKPRIVRNMAEVSIQQARMQPSQAPASIMRFCS